jgi:hypothetical protein
MYDRRVPQSGSSKPDGRSQRVTKSKNDMKRRRAEALGMPYGTAEKKLRKQIIFELARQLGKTTCCSCGGTVSSPDDLAVVHLQDWMGDPTQFWELSNVAFSHSTCAARRGGPRQEEAMSNNHIKVSIENEAGESLPGTNYKGQIYVAGVKGAKYQIRVRNTTNKKVLVVTTVDGRNVIDGEPGSFEGPGHILDPYQDWVFKGWRTSDDQVAAFQFGKKKSSYSSKLGTPENVGVIGLAVFEEKELEWRTWWPSTVVVKEHHHHYPNPWTITPYPRISWTTSSGEVLGVGSETVTQVYGSSSGGLYGSSGGISTMNCSVEGSASSSLSVEGGVEISQQIGTSYGESVSSSVKKADFKRKSSSPVEVLEFRYDTFESLRSAGIMKKRPKKKPRQPSAFPEEVAAGYCQPPPDHRRK